MGAKGLRLGRLRSTGSWAAGPGERESRAGGREEEEMTEDKARKRSIRTRMAKTGESYTAARRQVEGSAEPGAIRGSREVRRVDQTRLRQDVG